ncbi:transmembrane anchor protein [Hydrogenophaga borbori]|uniref:transmembrane anchor protein n=1 Tax=Hydrogenophaga borbori TaxID=2294117 RepID=UPI00301CBA23
MYNSKTPSMAELPSSRQLLRSTVIAALVASVLLVTVVFPAEYGKDWTGIGRMLGLTEMGEIKVALAREAAADAAQVRAPAAEPLTSPGVAAVTAPASAPESAPASASPAAAAPAPVIATTAAWRDEQTFSLAPGEGIEIKLVMKEGEKARYAWSVQGGVVNYDTHGDGSGRSISYVKGRGVPADEGELVAAFTGNHGWFWRNRGTAPVKLVLRTGGQYSAIKRTS